MKGKLIFEVGRPYHILSRAVEKRKIFEKEEDCYRFIFQIYAANVGSPAYNLWRKDINKAAKALLMGERISSKFIIREHTPLVNILDFALVINHNHFDLVPITEKGIEKYMQKVNGGFAKYYNLKYNRTGTLFESRYKRILIEDDRQLLAVRRYINIINPLDVFQPGWRDKGIKNQRSALHFLRNYPFSSFPDLFSERNSKILAPRKILESYLPEAGFNKREDWIKYVKDYLKSKTVSSFYLEGV